MIMWWTLIQHDHSLDHFKTTYMVENFGILHSEFTENLVFEGI